MLKCVESKSSYLIKPILQIRHTFCLFLKDSKSQRTTMKINPFIPNQTPTESHAKTPLNDDSQAAENAWFAQLLANLENKSLDQISERLKNTPNYLEQIEFEHTHNPQKAHKKAPLYAAKSAQSYLEEILDKKNENNQTNH